MKKIVSTLVFAGLTVATGSAFAQAAQLTNGQILDSADCSLLRDRVTVILSNDVTMAYNCNTAANNIVVAACHSSGSQRPTPIACAVVDATTTPVTYNDQSCDGTPNQTFEIAGRRQFSGSSTGGSVSAGNLNSETCTVGALTSLQVMQ